MIVSEGAGAVLLQRPDDRGIPSVGAAVSATRIEQIVPGRNFFRRSEATAELENVVARLEDGIGFGVGSANGTFIDRAERVAIGNELPLYSPKIALGESVGASTVWQLIVASQALKTKMLPGLLSLPADSRALVLACGLNQQTGALILRRSGAL